MDNENASKTSQGPCAFDASKTNTTILSHWMIPILHESKDDPSIRRMVVYGTR